MMTMVGKQQTVEKPLVICAGLPVRTDLRAGLAWDDIDDKAKEFFDKLTGMVSGSAPVVAATPAPAA